MKNAMNITEFVNSINLRLSDLEHDNKKLRKMIKSVAFRKSKNTRLFKEKYPDCN